MYKTKVWLDEKVIVIEVLIPIFKVTRDKVIKLKLRIFTNEMNFPNEHPFLSY